MIGWNKEIDYRCKKNIDILVWCYKVGKYYCIIIKKLFKNLLF